MLWLSMSTSPMTLTLDFQGPILKMLYLRNGMADWHGTKGMWVDRMLYPLCDFQLWPQPWPWPWIFKVKFWKSRISGMGWPIDTGWKGCELIECWTHVVTFNFPLTHDLGLEFSKSDFEKVLSYEWDGRLTWNVRDVSRLNVGPMLWLSLFTPSMTLTLDFQGQILKKKSYLRNGMADWHEKKGMWVDRMLDTHCDFKLWPHPWTWPWIFKVKYWNCCNSGVGGLTHLEWKGCELDMMLDAQWDWPWAMVHSKKIDQVMAQCETLTVSNLLANEWTIRSLI